MTTDELYQFLYAWANTNLGDLACPVIRAYQDAPPPTTDTYLVIEDSQMWDPVGQVSRGGLLPGALPNTYTRDLVTDYSVSVILWEVRGRGDRLRSLIASLDMLSVQQVWEAAKVSVMNRGVITAVPTLQDSRWRQQHRVELTLGVANARREELLNIETVEFINNIGGS